MRILIRADRVLSRAPIAGVPARQRIRERLGTVELIWLQPDESPARVEIPDDDLVWMEGLFPFFDEASLTRLLAHAREHGRAFCHGSGNPETGIAIIESAALPTTWTELRNSFQPLHHVPLDNLQTQVLDDASRFSVLNDYAYHLARESASQAGAYLIDPNTTWIEQSVDLAASCVIGPNVQLRGSTRIGSGAEIGMGSVITDSVIHPGALIKPYSIIDQSEVATGAHVGPFAHVRPGTQLAGGARIGNFVETKKAVIGPDSKASHLSYLGDVTIGRDCNIGAGTITCNYDGFQKHQTHLGDEVFIGSDSQLVAPVELGDGSYVGAGSTITRNVPAGDLALSRARQSNKSGWAEKIREKARRKKDQG